MYAFQMTIHARPAQDSQDVTPGPTIGKSGHQFNTLKVVPATLGSTTFACRFEEALNKLAELPRLYCEPDGSFVWVSAQQDRPGWQVDGNLYDRAERLLFVDVKGICPPAQFDMLLTALGWPEIALIFQLTREAVLLDEVEFRRWAEIIEPAVH